jgi:2-iminobutanoate/2-iminopropanoate deaminase
MVAKSKEPLMKKRFFNSDEAPAPVGWYSQALEATDIRRLVFVSGQIPVSVDGQVPHGFGAQCRLAWANVSAQLRAADMTMENVVKITTYLSDRSYGQENRDIRREVFGDLAPASTVIITGIFDEKWLLEIEAIAVG